MFLIPQRKSLTNYGKQFLNVLIAKLIFQVVSSYYPHTNRSRLEDEPDAEDNFIYLLVRIKE